MLVAIQSDEKTLRNGAYSRRWNISVFCTRTRNLDSRTLLTENLMCIRQRHNRERQQTGEIPSVALCENYEKNSAAIL